jgi:pimeloyl-ACP methyl ester carboxylesterase
MALWKIGALFVRVLAVGWLILAYASGTVIRDDSRYAVTPGGSHARRDGGPQEADRLGRHRGCLSRYGRGIVRLLHGCPFSVYKWHLVAPLLAKHFRVIAPDLIGLGDTPVRLNDDYRLPRSVEMVTALEVLTWQPERVILSHGRCVETDASSVIRRAWQG